MLSSALLSFAALAAAAPSNLTPRQQGFSASFTRSVTNTYQLSHARSWHLTNPISRYNGCGGSVACGISGGFTAAVSQNLFGVGSGAGAGPACGTCYSLSSGLPGTAPITVKVTNLCPADSNPLCAQQGLSGTNSLGLFLHHLKLRLRDILTKPQVPMCILISAQTMVPLEHSLEILVLNWPLGLRLRFLASRGWSSILPPSPHSTLDKHFVSYP